MRLISTLAALATGLFLLAAVPALADNNNNNNKNNDSKGYTKGGNQDLLRSAEPACRQTARNRGLRRPGHQRHQVLGQQHGSDGPSATPQGPVIRRTLQL